MMRISKVKRILLVMAFFITIAAVLPVYAQGGGKRLGVATGFENFVGVYRQNGFDIKLGYDFSKGNEFVFLGPNYRFVDQKLITGPLHFSLGAGGYLKYIYNNDFDKAFEWGLNLPIGLSLLVFDNFLEIFVEVAPGVEVHPKPAFDMDSTNFWIGATIGID